MPLTSATLSILGPHRTPPRYSVVVLCHRDLLALDLQIWPLHILRQIMEKDDVGLDVEMGQLVDLVLGLGRGYLVWSACQLSFPHRHHQGELSSTGLASLPSAAGSKEQGQSSYPHD